MIPPALSDAAVLASELFESLGIPHVIGGSVASTYYSEWRLTNDVDIAVDMRAGQIDTLVARGSDHFIIERSFVVEAVQNKRMFTMVSRRTFVKVDVYVRERVGFFDSQLKRARLASLRQSPRGEVWMQSREDLVLQKLSWYEEGGRASQQQWRDVKGVLKVWNDKLDEAYLHEWATKLDLIELLEAVRKEVASEAE